MRRNSFLRQTVLSFSSGAFYREVAFQPLAFSIRYLVLLLAAVSLLLSVRYGIALTKGLEAFEAWALRNLPEIVIEKGIVSSPAIQPWRYETEGFVAILDTTGRIQEIPAAFPEGLLLKRNELILKHEPFKTQSYDLSGIESFRLNAEAVSRLRHKGIWFHGPILFLGFFGYFVIGKSFQVFLFSVLSITTSFVAGRFLSYRAILNIGCYAITLPFLVTGGFLWLGPLPPVAGLLFVASYGALLVTAVLHCAPPREPAPEESL